MNTKLTYNTTVIDIEIIKKIYRIIGDKFIKLLYFIYLLLQNYY